jgi:hypothetical protein
MTGLTVSLQRSLQASKVLRPTMFMQRPAHKSSMMIDQQHFSYCCVLSMFCCWVYLVLALRMV